MLPEFVVSESALPAARRPVRGPVPALAALLSFLIPGLGQAYIGRGRLAFILALPVLVLVGLGLAGWMTGWATVARALLAPGVLVGILVLDLALLGWRLFAIGHAGLSARRRPGTANLAVIVLLLAATLVSHVWAGVIVTTADRTLGTIFGHGNPAGPVVGHLDREPESYGWDGTERINFLLVGYDSAPGREEELTDTMMVVSVDPLARSAVMISVPRDTGFVPLPDRRIYPDGVFPAKLNELAATANADPQRWCPDLAVEADCGTKTLSQAVGLYLGITIHQVAWIDLLGFASLIDALGGVDLCLPGRLEDPTYGGPTWYPKVGLVLEAGCAHYDGVHALAFARSRKGVMVMPDGSVVGQNDYLRAARQQEVLLSLQEKVRHANLLLDLPALMEAVGRTVSTDVPRGQAGDLAALATLIDSASVERVVLGRPDYVDLPLDPLRYYMIIPRREAIRAEMARILGDDVPLIGWYLGSTAEGPPAT